MKSVTQAHMFCAVATEKGRRAYWPRVLSIRERVHEQERHEEPMSPGPGAGELGEN